VDVTIALAEASASAEGERWWRDDEESVAIMCQCGDELHVPAGAIIGGVTSHPLLHGCGHNAKVRLDGWRRS